MSNLKPIEQTIANYSRAWVARDGRALAAVWDQAGPVFLLAREHREPLHDRAQIVAYLAAACERAEAIALEPEGIVARVLDADTASAFYFARWSIREKGEAKPIGGVLKTTAVFRLRGPKWRLVHLAEASYAPYRFFTEFFERTAESGFAGQPRRTVLP